jgi:hypothetical protein
LIDVNSDFVGNFPTSMPITSLNFIILFLECVIVAKLSPLTGLGA